MSHPAPGSLRSRTQHVYPCDLSFTLSLTHVTDSELKWPAETDINVAGYSTGFSHHSVVMRNPKTDSVTGRYAVRVIGCRMTQTEMLKFGLIADSGSLHPPPSFHVVSVGLRSSQSSHE